MDRSIGTSQASLANTSLATTTQTDYYITRWVGPVLNQTSVAANTWTLHCAFKESNGSANFPNATGVSGLFLNIYVWKPSNGTKYGTIVDGVTSNFASETSGTEETAILTVSGSAVSSLTSGDAVIVCEMWCRVTQSAATAYTQTVYYDGRLTYVNDVVATDIASYIQTPEDLSLGDTFNQTELYFHDTTSGLPSGTLPSAEQSAKTVTASYNWEGSQTTNRLMNTTIGTTQASRTFTTLANLNTNTMYVTRFVSPAINETSVPAATWTYNFAARESNVAANFPVNGANKTVAVCAYVWKPSNGTKYGDIFDGNTAGTTVSEGTISQERSQEVDFVGAAVSSLTSGDAVIVFEVWFVCAQTTAAAYNLDFFYDGTTETAGGSTVSNHASLLKIWNKTLNFGGAPTNFDRPLTAETISVSESIARLYASNRAPTAETITISESQARAFVGVRVMSAETNTIGESIARLKAANRTQTAETVTIGESLARLYNAIRAPTAETVSVSEAIAKVQVLVRSLSPETSAISESLTKILTLVRNIPAETNTIGESLVRVFVGVRALTAETIPISESLTRLKAATRALTAETTAISESLVRTFGVVRTLSDTTVIGESLTRVLAAIRALAAQTTTVGESLTKVQTLVRSLADTTIISETLNRMLAAIRALSAETSAIGESLTKVFTPVSGVTAHRPLAAETIAVSESLARVTTNVRTLIETTIIAETLTRLQVLTRALSTEITTISESLVSIKTLVRTLSQTTAISESLTKVVVLVRSLTDTTVISETLTRLQVLTRTLTTEIITISESLAAGKVLLKTLSETIPISESLTKVADRIRTLVDSVIIDESLSRVQVLTRALTTEIVNISESLSAVRPAIEVALVEFVAISENLASVLYHIVPLYLTSKLARIEGVAKRTRAYERDTESYMLKQLYRLIGRKYSVSRRSRSG